MISFDNFIIRPLELADLESYFDMVNRNRSRLEDFFTGTTSRTKDVNDTHIFLKEMIKRRTSKSYFPFVMVEQDSNAFVAFFDLKNIDWTIPKTEIGCYTDQAYSGKGITSKATSLFTDYVFETYGFKKILLRTHQTNKAAQVISERCGFVKEVIITMDYKTTKGDIIDLIYYGKLKM